MKKYFVLFCVAGLAACVPQRQFQEVQENYNKAMAENKSLKEKEMETEAKYNEAVADLAALKKSAEALKGDTLIMGNALRRLTGNYDQLDKTYRELLEVNEKILKGSLKDADELRKKYEKALEDLHAKEDAANTLQAELSKKEQSLAKLESEIVIREKKMHEMQSILNRKDSVVKALKDKLSQALLGFENNGLTIRQQDGKVYVSLENQLLFKSGSYDVDEKGKEAIKKLAKVLEQNPDINVTVEGHTDTDKYGGSGVLKDNWDLSVMRATQIVKLLMSSANIDAKRLTAAGRGEYLPIDPANNDMAKKKNRRTEIILTPKLDELYDMLNDK
ncbi:MAG: OmpA family protein [Flavobacteriales bacterium]